MIPATPRITPAKLAEMIAEGLEDLKDDCDLRYVIEELLGLDEDADMDDLQMALEGLEEWLEERS
jgi:hypothetical protein